MSEEFEMGANATRLKKRFIDGIEVHNLYDNPSDAWNQISETQSISSVPWGDLTTDTNCEKVRLVCISDTHNLHKQLEVPYGDILIHAGDFTRRGTMKEIIAFNDWLGTLPHPIKLVTAGNHEIQLDPATSLSDGRHSLHVRRSIFTNAVYLEDETFSFRGINFYGAPWTPEFGFGAFQQRRGPDIAEKWWRIPPNTHVLITHGPPVGMRDLNFRKHRCGCVDLLMAVQKKIKPNFHIFGHIHEGYGACTDESTTYVNASVCDLRYRPVNAPVIIDYKLAASS